MGLEKSKQRATFFRKATSSMTISAPSGDFLFLWFSITIIFNMFSKIIAILLSLGIIYAVYWVYTKTWPKESIKDTLRPLNILQVERSTSSRFGIEFKRKNWFEPYIPGSN